jgi:hypothetical protein
VGQVPAPNMPKKICAAVHAPGSTRMRFHRSLGMNPLDTKRKSRTPGIWEKRAARPLRCARIPQFGRYQAAAGAQLAYRTDGISFLFFQRPGKSPALSTSVEVSCML